MEGGILHGKHLWRITSLPCLVDLAANKGVVNGNFKVGAYTKLEKMMEERVFGCGVLAYPHIKSRLKILKSKFVAYQLCKDPPKLQWVEWQAISTVQLEFSVSDLTVEITQIRPAIEQAVDIMVNRLLGNDEDSNNKRQQIMTDLKNLPGLTRPQVIDVALILSRDENRRDLEFFYRLDTMDDRLYFILKMLSM
ncbi:hypothetical protein LINPERPRIM_LOCUS30301 [Linum perenne]